MRPPRTVGSTIFSIVLIWAMIAVAAAAFWPVYRDVRFVTLVVGALIGAPWSLRWARVSVGRRTSS